MSFFIAIKILDLANQSQLNIQYHSLNNHFVKIGKPAQTRQIIQHWFSFHQLK